MKTTHPAPEPQEEEGGGGSFVLFGLSILSILGATALGVSTVPMYTHEAEFGVSIFLLAALALGIVTLFLVVIPSWVLFERRERRRDRLSLRLSCLTLVMLVLEVVPLMMFGR